MTGNLNRGFPSTSWTLIAAAAGPRPEASVHRALEALCHAYWRPLYVYARRQDYPAEDAADLVQGYFAKLLEKDYLQEARRERGRFRSFLIASFRHYLSNERDRERAVKRGGAAPRLIVSVEDAERLYALETPRDLSPERVFERQWALTVLERAMSSLRREAEEKNMLRVFELAHAGFMDGKDNVRYAARALALNMSAGALKVQVHRMRKRLQRALRDEIAETVGSADEVEEELRFLIRAIA
jgi:RNA polymerase sigma-70 factor (ECF subfamily)